jgi:hypothetical protein
MVSLSLDLYTPPNMVKKNLLVGTESMVFKFMAHI